MKKIFYWCPFIDKVATIKAVINSCIGLKRYTKNNTPYIIDVTGEFEEFEDKLCKENINSIKLYKSSYIKNLPIHGFLKSRLTYLIIFFLSFGKLKSLLNKEKPDYLIVHLITSLPIFLFLIFNFKTKLILRISGLPKLTLFRKLLWKISKNKIYLVTTPTIDTRTQLIQQNIFEAEKIITLRDPILSMKEITKSKKEILIDKFLIKNKYLVSIGRLTRQKNHKLLIDSFSFYSKKNKDIDLVIIGDGEEKIELSKLIRKLNLKDRIHLIGFKENVFNYLYNARGFILSSKWEDPGFVLIEAAACRVPILSSNCPNGPKEFLEDGKFGILFNNNDKNDLIHKLDNFFNLTTREIHMMKLGALKNAKQFTIFNHASNLGFYLK
jgi:glycosyltransferase involved in cell wall biosynthesis|tara:strand:- start:12939 stop:14084 length:1146 start_codon:yes stop_codon:yes gene_type:complete